MLSTSRIAFVGCGVMGEAMIKGLFRNALVEAKSIIASDPYDKRRSDLAEQFGIWVTGNNKEAITAADIIILATKPQVLPDVMSEITGEINPSAFVLSIAAGVPVSTIASGLSHDAVVRVMPNTPAQIGEGMSVWYATDAVTSDQLEMAQMILGALGEELRVDNEGYLDMATALSGTGPAYVLLFMEAMIDAGVHMGFSRRIAEKLVLQTMRGTVEYADHSKKHPAVLRNEVTSPAGTTAAALYQMEKGQLRTVISKAIWAAYARSVELGGRKSEKSDR